jgi:phenylpropionate dioxygenase-like ring-hydroxylating dioxygenase large terminal subunit
MGELLRQYWLPMMLSGELPGVDCPPKRMRLLGENLVAYRDTEGTAGLLADNCPHRGASMFFGRNEESGLRCVYHGWKFDRTGACVDMPNEPPESNFKNKVRIGAYPCLERGGVVWAYMGPRNTPPPLPDLEWTLVPDSQRFVSMRLQECNWAQAFEGGIDSSHSGFLHSPLVAHRSKPEDYGRAPELVGGPMASYGVKEDAQGTMGMIYKARDKHPRFEVVDTDYGLVIGARRDADAASHYWRITQFLMPFYTMIPPYGESPVLGGHAWVPIDDEHTMTWSVSWHPTRPLTESDLFMLRDYPRSGIHPGVPNGLLPPTSEPYGAWWMKDNAANDYGRDFELERTKLFSGIPNLAIQDSAMQETMGAIYDRTREHLGSSDSGIIQTRRRLMHAARALLASGNIPPGVDAPGAYRVRAAGVVVPRDVDWVASAQPHLTATPGVHHSSA